MSDLRDLYQEVILDHNKRPRNFRPLPDGEPPRRGPQPALRRPAHRATSTSRTASSRTCAFEGAGCAISRASASLMTDAVKGKPVEEAERHVRGVPRAGHLRRGPTRSRRASASWRSSAASASSRRASSAPPSPGTRCTPRSTQKDAHGQHGVGDGSVEDQESAMPDPVAALSLRPKDHRRHLLGLRPRDPGQHLGARAHLRHRHRRRAPRARPDDADRPRLPVGAVAARSRSSARCARSRAWPTPTSRSSGSRPGPPTGCPTPPSCSSGCSDRTVQSRVSFRDSASADSLSP